MVAFTLTYTIVAFRGTKNIQDWLTNLSVAQVDGINGKFHSGFYKRAASIPLDEILTLAKGKPIYFVGHSLGGAIAQICALLCLERFNQTYPNITKTTFAISFGGPYIGTQEVQDFLSSKRGSMRLEDHILTVVNENDCVPGLLNIAATLTKSETVLNKYQSKVQSIVNLIQPAYGNIIGEAVNISASVTQFMEKFFEATISEYKPAGMYMFIEVKPDSVKFSQNNLVLSPFLGHTHYPKIHAAVSASNDKISVLNVQHHGVWNYGFNLKSLFEDSIKQIVSKDVQHSYVLPRIGFLLSGLKQLKALSITYPSILTPKLVDAIIAVTKRTDKNGKTSIMLPSLSRQEYRAISKPLFKMGMQTFMFCVTPYSFLQSAFYEAVGNYNFVSESLFKRDCSLPIAKYEHVVTLSSQLSKEFKTSTDKVSLFFAKCFINGYPFGDVKHLSEEAIQEKWIKEIEGKYCNNVPTATILGGMIIAVHREEHSCISIVKCLRRYVRFQRLKKNREEELNKIVTLSPNFFAMISASVAVREILGSFGNMIVMYGGEKVTIARMTETIANTLQVQVSNMRAAHVADSQKLINEQKQAFKQLTDNFFSIQKNIGETALEQQIGAAREFKEKLEAIYTGSWSWYADLKAEDALYTQEMQLTEIQQQQWSSLEELHASHEQAHKELVSSQQAELSKLEHEYEKQRLTILNDNQLGHIFSATLSGAVVGAVTNLIISLVSESIQIYYKKKTIPKALYDMVCAAGKGAVVGSISGGVVALVETSAEIAAAGSLMRQLLKGNGAVILSTSFFTVEIIGIFRKWHIGEMSVEQLQASLLTTSAQFLGGNFLGYVTAAAVALFSTNPLFLAAGWIAGSIAGSYFEKKAGEIADEVYIRSADAKLDEAYKLLGLPVNAKIEDVNRKYRKLVLEYHPDKTMHRHLLEKDKQERANRFVQINLAVETIRNASLLKLGPQKGV